MGKPLWEARGHQLGKYNELLQIQQGLSIFQSKAQEAKLMFQASGAGKNTIGLRKGPSKRILAPLSRPPPVAANTVSNKETIYTVRTMNPVPATPLKNANTYNSITTLHAPALKATNHNSSQNSSHNNNQTSSHSTHQDRHNNSNSHSSNQTSNNTCYYCRKAPHSTLTSYL
ncbi:hypothetical protein BCR42DRAFT_442855 [Absidia repens]|uniref:Uncharacterized protein n=1 Tax=Absidia repens TaxID=90262 RepID=A0A1X2I150_9FUNG|nr:hypothetical protein BCR42DRAFT_442855 [Absidia repens]